MNKKEINKEIALFLYPGSSVIVSSLTPSVRVETSCGKIMEDLNFLENSSLAFLLMREASLRNIPISITSDNGQFHANIKDMSMSGGIEVIGILFHRAFCKNGYK